jgi:hypothetical protein
MHGWIAVAIGGALGSVNTVGCWLIRVRAGLIATGRLPMRTNWREFIFVGILGGFTTYSTFGLDTITWFAPVTVTGILEHPASRCLRARGSPLRPRRGAVRRHCPLISQSDNRRVESADDSRGTHMKFDSIIQTVVGGPGTSRRKAPPRWRRIRRPGHRRQNKGEAFPARCPHRGNGYAAQHPDDNVRFTPPRLHL